MKSNSCFLILVYLFIFNTLIWGQPGNFNIAPLPQWVELQSANYSAINDAKNNGAGFRFLLVDRQENLLTREAFVHNSIKMLNSEGLQSFSDFSFDFDPSYERLTIHTVEVIRDGEVINQLRREVIKVVQREANMERHLYDGRLTAVLNLPDIRIGDVINYAYSIRGANPVYAGHYSRDIYLQYQVPMDRIYIRLIMPTNRTFNLQYYNQAPPPDITRVGNNDIYIWDEKNVAKFSIDTNTPSWYNPYQYVGISDYDSWKAVIDWGQKLFDFKAADQRQLKQLLGTKFDHGNLDSTIIQAIRFVQDDVRYLGFLNGLNTMQPHSPLQVFEQRYGDCKDKSFLLSEMLKLYDVEAFPVLVHSSNGLTLKNELPSPNVFNHCIVQLIRNGKKYYIDPTINYQGGDLARYYIPEYHLGLVIDTGENTLTEIPLASYSNTKVNETYVLQEVGKGAVFTVETTYEGANADYQRGYIASNDLQTIQQNMLNFYSRIYPGISVLEEIQIEDRRDRENMITMKESYKIDQIWEVNEDSTFYFEAYPLDLHNIVTVAKSPARTMPYWVSSPVNMTHETEIHLPESWDAEESAKSIDGAAFHYKKDIRYENKIVNILHHYETKQPYINAEEVRDFIASHDKIKDNLSYFLYYDKSYDRETSGGEQFSFFALFFTLVVLLAGGYAAVRIYYEYDLPVKVPDKPFYAIGGWLTLPAIGLTMTPIFLIITFLATPEYFDSSIWREYFHLQASFKEMYTGLFYLFGFLMELLFFIFSVMLIFLFFNRRSTLPQFIIAFYVADFGFALLAAFAATAVNPEAYTVAEQQAFSQIGFGPVFKVLVWIPYFMVSQRVRRTFFTKSRRNSEKPVEDLEVNEKGSRRKSSQVEAGILVGGVVIFILFIVVSLTWNANINSPQQPSNVGYEPGKSVFSQGGNDLSDIPVSYVDGARISDPNFKLDLPEASEKIARLKYVILQCVSRNNEKVHLRIITVEKHSTAENILAQLNQGGSFQELAKAESDHLTNKHGGDLGIFSLTDLSGQFQDALEGLNENGYSEILEVMDW